MLQYRRIGSTQGVGTMKVFKFFKSPLSRLLEHFLLASIVSSVKYCFSASVVLCSILASLAMASIAPPLGFPRWNAEDLRLLVLATHFEAGVLSDDGKAAVIHSILNRVKSKNYPNTITKVVKQGGTRRFQCQYTFMCDGKHERVNKKDLESSERIVRLVLRGAIPNPVPGAVFYFNPKSKTVRNIPCFAMEKYFVRKVGDHYFYRMSPYQERKRCYVRKKAGKMLAKN